jgi:hypothetical protein
VAARTVDELQGRLDAANRRYAELVEATTADATAQVEQANAQAKETAVALAAAQQREVARAREAEASRAAQRSP